LSRTFRALGQIRYGPRGFWLFESVLRQFKTVVEACVTI